MIVKWLKFSLSFLLSIIDVNMKSESQCDSCSAAPIIIGVIISIISIAVGISGLIVAVIMFKRMR